MALPGCSCAGCVVANFGHMKVNDDDDTASMTPTATEGATDVASMAGSDASGYRQFSKLSTIRKLQQAGEIDYDAELDARGGREFETRRPWDQKLKKYV